MPSTPTPTQAIDFEASLKELEALVERMEQGDISLEESMKLFERGVTLTRSCQTALKEAEQKVHVLLDKRDDTRPEEFESHDGD